MDDYLFPSYTSPKIPGKTKFSDVGDAFVRELDYSKMTLRLVSKPNPKGNADENTVAKIHGDTLKTLSKILYTPTPLTMRSSHGESVITMSAQYIPVQMKLDPKESILNMGNLRVDVMDAADLPSADRNGYSDPFCKFLVDDKDVYKTKVQKKTLHPAWNEFFETPIKSRIGGNFHVNVYDWDFGDKADLLGGTHIDLEQLEPGESKEVSLDLDGQSGAIRLKLLFKPAYVTRESQGTSTVEGAFAVPGKVIGAPVKGVGMVGGAVGGGVVKGASFMRHGLFHRKKHEQETVEAPPSPGSANQPPAIVEESPAGSGVVAGGVGAGALHHSRSRSSVSQVGSVAGGVGGGKGESGIATITIVGTKGFPDAHKLHVIVKSLAKGSGKDVHKTKAHKSSDDGEVDFDTGAETFKVTATADTQYQIRVMNHATFGSDSVLGEGPFFVDDQGSVAGQDKQVPVGDGVVIVRSSFTPKDSSAAASPAAAGGGPRASMSQRRPSTSQSVIGDAASELTDSPSRTRRSFLGKRNVSGA